MSRYRSTRWPQVLWTAALVLSLVGLTTFYRGGVAQEGGTLNMDPATPNALGPAIPPEVTDNPDDWVVPMGDYQAHRSASNSTISTQNVSQLGVAWTFPITTSGPFGAITSVPIVVGDTIYLQDMQSSVYALDRASGKVKWTKEYNVPTEGPNGVAIGYGMLFGALGNTSEVFAISAEDGHEIWRIRLSFNDQVGVDMVPTVYNNVVYISTVPGSSANFYQGGQRGILYALDAGTGTELWEFDTTTDNLWGNARINSGGGLWYPPSVDDQGNIYFGTGNAAPWPGIVIDGTPYPNGASRPGDNDYASSMVSLDTTLGSVRWSHNAKPHDLFDLDFQATPILATVTIDGVDTPIAIGSGKAGRVIAVNADTGVPLWDTSVGTHQNDELQAVPPDESVEVYPGTLGGVETPMAYANGLVFVPVVNLSNEYSATAIMGSLDLSKATGELVAINAVDGSIAWDVPFSTMLLAGAVVANDVVFTAGLDGVVHGLNTADGTEVWTYQASAGINAPLAVSGDLLLVPAGGFFIPSADTATPAAAQPSNALIALQIGGAQTPPEAPATSATAAPSPKTPVAESTPSDGQGEAGPMIELVDIAYNPNELSIPANTDVTITLQNSGAAAHTFTVTDHNNANVANLGIDVEVQPGQSATVTVNAPPGDYYFYCTVPGHEQAGMVGTLHVS